MKNNLSVLGFQDYQTQGQALAEQLGCEYNEVQSRHFPDDEVLIRLPTVFPSHVVICRSLDHPNDKLIELLLIARTLKEKGVERISLVCPYLCYMRQDIENKPGEVISQRIVGSFLASLFNDVITVDPHLHRISSLAEAIPIKNALSLSAAPAMGDYIKTNFPDAILFGPDEESEQWVASAANSAGLNFAVGRKVRRGDKDVHVTLPDYQFNNKTVVILDDVASTGRTVTQAAALLREAGAIEVNCMVTHALFGGDAEQHLLSNGIKHIWSTDSISHASNVLTLSSLITDTIKDII